MDMKGFLVAASLLCFVTAVTTQSGSGSGSDSSIGSDSSGVIPTPGKRNESSLEEARILSRLKSGELFEGDLKLSGELVHQLYDFSSIPSNDTSSCAGTTSLSAVQEQDGEYLNLWPEGVIYYSFDPSISVSLAHTVRAAMDEWEAVTCLHFVSKDSEVVNGSSTSYVNFTATSGGSCYSDSVGMRGGQQVVSLGNSGCQTRGEIMHLIGHVVGLWHEQSRPDRDDYLVVISKNIKEGRRQDFMKLKGSGKEYKASGLLYDYGSIMHYSLSAFSKCENNSNGCPPLIVTIPSEYIEQGSPTVGQREELGEGDVQKIELLYGSSEDVECPPPTRKGRLVIHIDSGYNLPRTGDIPDSYVKVTANAISLDGKTIEKVVSVSTIRPNAYQPVWDESLDLGGREWIPLFRIEAWDSDVGADEPISIPEVIMIDKLHEERNHCSDPACDGYFQYSYNFTEDGDECLPNPCQNGGSCIDGISSYTCSCPPAWTGTNCHIRLACYDEPCQNGGMCNEHTNHNTGTSTYTCSCPSDWIGNNCDSRLACHSQPCRNGGTCTNRNINYNAGTSTYTCSCPSDWIGSNCHRRLACHSQPCRNGGSCTNRITDYNAGTSTYTCSCRSGGGWIGPTCADRCPCRNGGTCNQPATVSSYYCHCPYGWVGALCEIRRARLRILARHGTGLQDRDGLWNDSDPYVKIVAYKRSGVSVTMRTRTDGGDLSPEWNQWLDFGIDTWDHFTIRVYDDDANADDPLSSWESVQIYPGSHTWRTHSCYRGHIRYDYYFD